MSNTDHDRALDYACQLHADGTSTETANLVRSYMHMSGSVEEYEDHEIKLCKFLKSEGIDIAESSYDGVTSLANLRNDRIAALESFIAEVDASMEMVALTTMPVNAAIGYARIGIARQALRECDEIVSKK